MDPVTSNRGRMMRTTPELPLSISKLPHHASGRTLDVRFNVNPTHIKGGSSVESGVESGTLRLRRGGSDINKESVDFHIRATISAAKVFLNPNYDWAFFYFIYFLFLFIYFAIPRVPKSIEIE
ncbi:hypothetical protein AVEN_165199-1 [Araneus ventricosus]|uniref:Uncharacterized protein n=1 Tax=Araneus ventricosus TaxID=182803 RepID=A0A4Y2B743_ARAVE|nr:hypothetical protein AVEN_165199-1 [Araneus ventricosus]